MSFLSGVLDIAVHLYQHLLPTHCCCAGRYVPRAILMDLVSSNPPWLAAACHSSMLIWLPSARLVRHILAVPNCWPPCSLLCPTHNSSTCLCHAALQASCYPQLGLPSSLCHVPVSALCLPSPWSGSLPVHRP